MANKAPSLFSGATIQTGPALGVLALLSLILATGLMLLLVFGTYERRERVAGFIAPTSGLVRIVPPRLGVVTRVEVVDDQHVLAGQALLAISSLRATADGDDADAAQVAGLEQERINLSARVAREAQLAELRTQDAVRRIEELHRQVENLQSQRRLAEERAQLLNRELARLELLKANAHVSQSLLDERRSEVLTAQQSATALAHEQKRLQSDIAGLEAELGLMPLDLIARQDELAIRILEIDRRLAEAEVQRETLVRAPVSGRVTSLLAFPGQSVTPNQAMLAILPDDAHLQAVLLVPSQAAGFIRSGQEVRLRYDAFPHQRFGVHRAVVSSVSRTMLNPGDQVGPMSLQGPAYRVIATLDAESVMAYGEAIPLQSDLTLQADIVRERMSIIEWIFDPVRAAVSAL